MSKFSPKDEAASRVEEARAQLRPIIEKLRAWIPLEESDVEILELIDVDLAKAAKVLGCDA